MRRCKATPGTDVGIEVDTGHTYLCEIGKLVPDTGEGHATEASPLANIIFRIGTKSKNLGLNSQAPRMQAVHILLAD